MIFGSIPFMSLIDHANVEVFCRRNSMSSSLMSAFSSVPTPTYHSGLSLSKLTCVMRLFWAVGNEILDIEFFLSSDMKSRCIP